jgi:hypothetical protein
MDSVMCKQNHQCLPCTFTQSRAFYMAIELPWCYMHNWLMLQLHINLCQLKQKKQYILHNVPKVGELQIFVVDMKFFT